MVETSLTLSQTMSSLFMYVGSIVLKGLPYCALFSLPLSYFNDDKSLYFNIFTRTSNIDTDMVSSWKIHIKYHVIQLSSE